MPLKSAVQSEVYKRKRDPAGPIEPTNKVSKKSTSVGETKGNPDLPTINDLKSTKIESQLQESPPKTKGDLFTRLAARLIQFLLKIPTVSESKASTDILSSIMATRDQIWLYGFVLDNMVPKKDDVSTLVDETLTLWEIDISKSEKIKLTF